MLHPYTARKDLGAGHDRYAFELVTRLPGLGIDLDLFESGELTGIPQTLWAEARAVVRLIRKQGPALYHATATANAMAPLTARRRPLLTTIHDVLWFHVKAGYDNRLKYLLKTRAIKRAASRSDGIIVPFQSTLDFLVGELAVPRDRIFLIPYGVDHAQFRPAGEEDRCPRPACLGPKRGREVLFVGAVNFGKGIDTLIRCFDRVVEAVPDARLLVGSRGWDLPLIRSLWEESPARGAIEFIGFIPEEQLRSAYVHADVTCFPSRYGFGLATLESMACGTPTVSGRTLDAPEFIGEAGLMADPNDPDELAHQLVRALTEEKLRHDLVIRGLEKSAQYNWQFTAERTAQVYRAMCGWSEPSDG